MDILGKLGTVCEQGAQPGAGWCTSGCHPVSDSIRLAQPAAPASAPPNTFPARHIVSGPLRLPARRPASEAGALPGSQLTCRALDRSVSLSDSSRRPSVASSRSRDDFCSARSSSTLEARGACARSETRGLRREAAARRGWVQEGSLHAAPASAAMHAGPVIMLLDSTAFDCMQQPMGMGMKPRKACAAGRRQPRSMGASPSKHARPKHC